MSPVHSVDWLLICVGLAVVALLGVVVVWRGVVGHRSQLFGPSVCRGAGRRRSVALTFDDGPSPGTLDLVRLLAEQRIKATFFVCGANVERHPEIVRAVAQAAHELGNHTYSHARLCPRLGWSLNLLSRRAVFDEVAQAQQAIEEHAGVTPRLLRAPYGFRWRGLRAAQHRFGLLGVTWTVIGHDWQWPADEVASHILRNASPGGILCLHDGRDTHAHPDIAATLEATGQIVAGLKARGYCFETVSELLRSDADAVCGRDESRQSSPLSP